MILKYRKQILIFYGILTIVCILFLPKLKFSFSFEHFFPQGDDDLDFFLEFIEDFETDDNFLLIGLKNEPSVFDSSFLSRVKGFTEAADSLPYVISSQSLSSLKVPVISPFGLNMVPLVKTFDKASLQKDSINIMNDPRWKFNLISEDAKSLTIALKHDDYLGLEESTALMESSEALLEKYGFKEYHHLGRVYFQHELAYLQIREFIVSSSVSFVLVCLILFLLFRQKTLIIISLSTILLGLIIFMGIISILGRELNAISVLYPVIMLIVGTSDVIHIVTKYIDELKKGHSVEHSLDVTIRQIGLATLLTSLTTAVGFAALMTSRIQPVKDFGINSAFGVVLAYFVVITFTLALLTYLSVDKLKNQTTNPWWDRWMEKIYKLTITKKRQIFIGSLILLGVFIYGISLVSTNYKIENNLPRKGRITTDFKFFEEHFSGFRPLEYAVLLKDGKSVFDHDVLTNINALDEKINSYPGIKSTQSINDIFKSLNMASHFNDPSYYTLPDSAALANMIQVKDAIPSMMQNVLVSKSGTKTRISSRIIDEGADKVKAVGEEIEAWAKDNLDASLMSVRRTGTGFLIDKNAVYVRESLIYGLLLALGIISVLMVFLFRDIKMLFIALVPNLFPLLFAAALLGYLGIELEASISIVFAIVFGIAVDDSIHFLSKYKLSKNNMSSEEAILVTFKETGKAITFTTLVLFFGFMVMLFSNQPASMTVGLLISITLLSAWLADLLILPLLLRFFYK